MYLTQGLHRAAQQQPDKVMTVQGARRRTFAQVIRRVSRLASGLRRLGVDDGDRVAMLSLNSDCYNEYLLAVPWANAVLNPVNFRWRVHEIAYCLRDSGSRVLLVDEHHAGMVPALREAVPGLETVIGVATGGLEGMVDYEELAESAAPMDDARRGGGDLAGVFYTGGTAGEPKGVMLSHANLGTSTLGTLASGCVVQPGARTLHVAPMYHMADLWNWVSTLVVGGTHVMLPAFDPRSMFDAIATHQVTATLVVPTMIQLMVDHTEIGKYDLSSLRNVLYGASPISQAVLERAMKAFPNAAFTQGYGMTELAPIATLLTPEDHKHERLLRSAGRAAPHAEVRVADGDGHDLPAGTVGEVVVRGGHVMQGYWNKPAETASAMRDGWMHTGDAGYLDVDGYLYIVDRFKDMIVTGGENVYSVEVENAIASHPAVAQCAVIGIPDERWGESVHAFVVLHPGAAAEVEDIREHTMGLIAGYKAPRSVEVVPALPVSGAGKILKRELREKYWDGTDRDVH